MKKSAFTLIELIVVISIMVIIASSSIFYFMHFIDSQKVNQKISIIDEQFKDLDKKVNKYTIFDYKLFLSTSDTGSILYFTYLNNIDIPYNQTITILNKSGSGIIKTPGATGSGILKLYKKNKLYLNEEINRGNDFSFDFNIEKKYKISGTYSGTILNDIELNYFSEDNLYPEKNDLLKLIEINTKEDKTGTGYTDIQITNVGGNKIIGNNEKEIYLFFENKGVENFIKIEK